MKRTAEGEARRKEVRSKNFIPISSLLALEIASQPPASKPAEEKVKPRLNTTKQGLSEYFGKYDVVSGLANASSSLTFGQLIRGDGDQAKTDIRRLLTRGASLRRNVTAAVDSSLNLRP